MSTTQTPVGSTPETSTGGQDAAKTSGQKVAQPVDFTVERAIEALPQYAIGAVDFTPHLSVPGAFRSPSGCQIVPAKHYADHGVYKVSTKGKGKRILWIQRISDPQEVRKADTGEYISALIKKTKGKGVDVQLELPKIDLIPGTFEHGPVVAQFIDIPEQAQDSRPEDCESLTDANYLIWQTEGDKVVFSALSVGNMVEILLLELDIPVGEATIVSGHTVLSAQYIEHPDRLEQMLRIPSADGTTVIDMLKWHGDDGDIRRGGMERVMGEYTIADDASVVPVCMPSINVDKRWDARLVMPQGFDGPRPGPDEVYLPTPTAQGLAIRVHRDGQTIARLWLRPVFVS